MRQDSFDFSRTRMSFRRRPIVDEVEQIQQREGSDVDVGDVIKQNKERNLPLTGAPCTMVCFSCL